MRGTVDGLNANPRLTVELITGEVIEISVSIQGKTTCNVIWREVEVELVARGVVHPQIFGLAIKSGSDWVFVDLGAKLSKYYPNICKEGKHAQNQHPGTGTVNDGNKPAFYCRVHYYLDALPQNLDVVSLHHYYIQLRQNVISAPRFPPASIVQPLAYALQFELGDWRPGLELSRWITLHPLISSLVPALTRAHQTLSGLAKGAARLAFIRAVMPQYNMHLFGMTLKTKEERHAPAWIGVTPKGIEVYQNAMGCKEVPAQPKLTFLWANITKLYFERKKYEIHGKAFPWGNSTQKLIFTASSEAVPQHLLQLCRSTHQFHLSNHKILMAAAEAVNNGNGHGSKGSGASSTGGESSCNSTLSTKNDDKMLDLSLWADGLLLPGESNEHQRVSVISNASSNTTSGIVSSSDRVYSLDGSEAEDLEIREMPDCCNHNHDQNSTSLESLTQNQRYSLPQRPHNSNLSRAHFHSHNHASSSNTTSSSKAVNNGVKCRGQGQGGDDSEAKYWYCDSDCEDCDDTGHCRSMIADNRECNGHCKCNPCEAEEDDKDCDGTHNHHFHHNTPSMASEGTLKAVDFECLDGTIKGESVEKAMASSSSSVENDKVQTTTKHGVVEESNEGEEGEIEEYKLEDEHVYGEISEDPVPLNNKGDNTCAGSVSGKGKKKQTENEQQYSTIEEEGEQGKVINEQVKAPKPKPRYSCMKTTELQKAGGCKCKANKGAVKCCSAASANKLKHSKKESGTDNTVCSKECKKYVVSAASSNNVSSGGKENGLTPKVASLKCLRKVKPSCNSTNIKRHISNRHKGDITTFAELPPATYAECIGEKLQQGRYPSTRTVSDNFDTDSDYVQLPPLAWYPPPRPPPKKPNSLKIWKCVTKNATGKPKQASPPSLSPPVNISTLPRRTSMDHSCNDNDGGRSNLIACKVSSRSTNAINLVGHARPEPPPKPRKSMADLTSIGKEEGTSVDARFIATKPQILIQTAYATNAPVAIPSQAQVLMGNSNNPPPPPTNTNAPVLKHSQSVDNIYDTVASEDPFVPCSTPPPYPAKTSATPLIIRPNNYIDVHASSVKNKLSNKPTTMAIGNHYITNPSVAGAFAGKNASRTGSVPNNLNNFLIGLQNLKPLSRTPIVHPAATSCMALNNGNNNNNNGNNAVMNNPGNLGNIQIPMKIQIPVSSSAGANNPRFTTVYTNHLSRSQIQQFKAQLYSDLDYVIFPPKDPRVSQQEYFDSKYTTVPATTTNPMLSSPPYLPPPPPYPATTATHTLINSAPTLPPPLPKKNPKLTSSHNRPTNHANHNNSSVNVTPALSNHSIAATITTSPSYHHNSFQSLYNPGSTASYCSSSQYGYYTATAASAAGLNSENLQRYLSTQSFTGSTASTGTPIYYASSTQSAPPLPPYKPSNKLIIENGMRKAVQQLMSSRASAAGPTASDERLKMNMKLGKSEESLYSQPTNETEEQLQAIYNLPPPPPYKKTPLQLHTVPRQQETTMSAAELDLAHLRAKCNVLELPLLRALCSEGELLNTNTSTKAIMQAARNRVRPTAHAHPKLSLPPKNPLPIPPKPNSTSTAIPGPSQQQNANK